MLLFIADDAHKSTNETFFEAFNELQGILDGKVRFLFAAREMQLDKKRPEIERALRKIHPESQLRIGFTLEDALLFLRTAVRVSKKSEVSEDDLYFGANLFKYSRGETFRFFLGLKSCFLGLDPFFSLCIEMAACYS
jgi:hypothetical protein